VIEWYGKDVFESICTDSLKQHLKRQIDGFINQLKMQFTIVNVEVGGIDFSVWRICLRVSDKPIAPDTPIPYEELNCKIKVVTNGSVVNEVKRDGIMIDRN